MNSIYTLFSHSWSGLVIASLIAVLGFVITRVQRWRIVRWFGFAVCALALVMAVASLVAVYRISRAQNAYPPMGKLVDVGGYHLHILAEGDANGGPTLVWIPGGHGPGLALYHLHKAMRGETRSILFDRPGTGWSDTGPFPVSTKREAEELNTLLTNAGEQGPFILLGHSYGGLLAANYARRYQKNMAALVCGGWPPLGAPYREMYEGTSESAPDPPARAMPLLRDKKQYAQWVTYHRSLLRWPEARAVAHIRCPRLALYAAKTFLQVGSHALMLSDTLRARRPELEKAGWRVQELTDRDTGVMLDPSAILPPLRTFLDQAT